MGEPSLLLHTLSTLDTSLPILPSPTLMPEQIQNKRRKKNLLLYLVTKTNKQEQQKPFQNLQRQKQQDSIQRVRQVALRKFLHPTPEAGSVSLNIH